jgi:hypothetical protein
MARGGQQSNQSADLYISNCSSEQGQATQRLHLDAASKSMRPQKLKPAEKLPSHYAAQKFAQLCR